MANFGQKETRAPIERPTISKTKRLDNFAITCAKKPFLVEGEFYIGRIIESYALQGDNGTRWKLIIALEDGSGNYETSQLVPLSSYSALNDLVADAEAEKGDTVECHEFIKMRVRFSVKYRNEFCNLKSIEWIEEAEVDASEDVDETSNYEDNVDYDDLNDELDDDEVDDDDELDDYDDDDDF